MDRRTFKGNSIVHEEEYHQGRDDCCGRESKSYLGEVQKDFWGIKRHKTVEEDLSSQMSKIKNHLQQTVSLNAPKSERTSQRHLESTQSEIPIQDCVICMYVHA